MPKLNDNKGMLSDEQIKKAIEKENVATIFLQFTDINGSIKTLNMPSTQIDDILSGKIMFDGSSISGFRENETLDLVICPDKSTFEVLPFKYSNNKKTARIICDIHNADNTPFAGCPRSNLKNLMKKINNEYGLEMQIGPEIEFFLFKTDKNNNVLDITEQKSGYYDVNLSYEYDEMVMEILQALLSLGFAMDAIHHEGAPFQYEVDLGFDNILKTADNLITFKFIVKTIADQFGYKASFMPKPIYGKNGSGLHLNISMSDKNGENIFYDKNGLYQLSEIALNSIASLLKNIKGITAVLNPTVNSYKRLVKDYEAPIYIVWSVVTRSALIRIPQKRGKSTRLELRSPDPAMNPYLAFAVIFQTCIDGIRNNIDPPRPIEKNLFQLSSNEIKQRKIKSLPRNMFTALEEFEKSMVAKVALGEFLFSQFIYSKRKEWKDYRKQVTPWELKKYIDI